MKKSMLLLAAGAGYVLGAKAGRERYDQIASGFDSFRKNPKVQAGAQQAADLAKEKAPTVADKVGTAASAAAGKVRPGGGKDQSSGTDHSSAQDQLNPDSIALQDDPYPKGNLP